jgi:hypothetical protein
VSAILKHGSYLRFGCLQFVFGVMDYNNHQEQDDTAILSLTKKIKSEEKEEGETEGEKEKIAKNEEVKMEEDSADE